MELLRPILELGVVIPGMLLAYFPVKSSLKQPLSKLVLWLAPLLALLCAAGGMVCYARRMPTAPVLAGLTLLAAVIYIKTLRISLWKSGTVALSVCAVFACINSLCRAINAAMLAGLPQAQAAPWFCLRAVICYHAICWLFAAIAYYPATHSVRRMVEDENFAQTWYVFWVLPLVFIALNLFMIPKYADTLYTGRVLQGYFVISIALLFLMLFFNAIFLLMAISINRNVRLQQENQLLSMQIGGQLDSASGRCSTQAGFQRIFQQIRENQTQIDFVYRKTFRQIELHGKWDLLPLRKCAVMPDHAVCRPVFTEMQLQTRDSGNCAGKIGFDLFKIPFFCKGSELT